MTVATTSGCQDDDEPDVINGQCLCREELNCPKGKQCKVDLKISGLVEHPQHFLKDNFVCLARKLSLRAKMTS